MAYRRRIIDDVLDDALTELPALCITGAKGVGKSETASRRVRTVLNLAERRSRTAAEGNYDLITQLAPPIFIDEWQLAPHTWDRVRTAVDDGADPGSYVLAGSARINPRTRIHSGAGRIVELILRPLSLYERGICQATVSLAALFTGKVEITGVSPLAVGDYVEEILASGFPGIRGLSPANRREKLQEYLVRTIDHELVDNGMAVRRPDALGQWLKAYGAASATTTSYRTISHAASSGHDKVPARNTVDSYRAHLLRLHILDPIPAWTPVMSPLKYLAKSPKHHLVDPALAAHMMGIGRDGLLLGRGQRLGAHEGTWCGALFESLAAQSVRVYADAIGARVTHLRTSGGEHEIDLMVESPDGKIVAAEVKLAETVSDKDCTHLLWLKEQLGEKVADLIILYTGPHAYRHKSGVAVIPLALLKP